MAVLSALPAALPAQTQSPAPADKEALLKCFDKDGDGKLNKAERAQARKAMRCKMANFDELCKKRVRDVMTKFDKDGDGKLDEAELSNFLDEQRQMFERMRKHRAQMRQRAIPKEIMAKFDKNGDGVLDKVERRAMMLEHVQKRKAMIKKYDADGDGKLNDAERAALLQDPEVQKMVKRILEEKTPPPPPPEF